MRACCMSVGMACIGVTFSCLIRPARFCVGMSFVCFLFGTSRMLLGVLHRRFFGRCLGFLGRTFGCCVFLGRTLRCFRYFFGQRAKETVIEKQRHFFPEWF